MINVYIIFLIVVILVYLLLLLSSFPRKCSNTNCRKLSMYRVASTFKERKTEMKDVTKTKEYKNSKGEIIKEIFHEKVPYEYSIYEDIYKCDKCGNFAHKITRKKHITYKNFEEYKSKMILRIVILTIVFCIICGILLSFIIKEI